jgi:hypothetical protein
MELIKRRNCCMCYSIIEHFYTIPRLPVFASSISQEIELDIFADQAWGECDSCGLIQLMELVPVDVLYSKNHNAEVVGQIWKQHHSEFADFIYNFNPRDILEVGASHGHLADLLILKVRDLSYTMLDPNLGKIRLSGVRKISGFIEDHTELINGSDIVMSHVLEHIYDSGEFLKLLSKNMRAGNRLFLSTPQIYEWLKLRSPNALNFEHTFFLNMDQVISKLKILGFDLIQQSNFQTHSLFSVFEKRISAVPSIENYVNDSIYKAEFQNFIEETREFSQLVNESVSNLNSRVYLYGASLFSQTLLSFGLSEDHIDGVLDNAKSKWGERLYGTSLRVESPEILALNNDATVILKMGPYQNEIKKQLEGINPSITILE